MKYFDSIMSGQLNQVSNNSRQRNELSDNDEPDLQQLLIEEACQRLLNQKRLLNVKQAKLKYKSKLRKIAVSGLLKEFYQRHTDSARHPNSAILLDINEIYNMYTLFFLFLFYTIISLIRLNLFTQLDSLMSMKASEKACQN